MATKPLNYNEKVYLELEAEMEEKLNNRRRGEPLSQVIYIKRTTKNKKEKLVYGFQGRHTFLQYIRMVMRWASKKLGVGNRYVELILYFYPIGVFNYHQFNRMCKTVMMYQQKQLQYLINEGLVKVWREAKPKQPTLYCLTDKAVKVCARMHRVMLGEEGLPTTVNNPLTTSGKAIDKYYLQMIKEMNSKVDKRKAERESNPSE